MRFVSLIRAVARATGETCHEIRRRGFGPADPLDVDFDPEPNERLPQIVDWDELESGRLALFPRLLRRDFTHSLIKREKLLETLIWIGVGLAVVAWLFGDSGGGSSGGHRHSGGGRCRCHLF